MKIYAMYLDDLIIFSDTLEEHLNRLVMVLNMLKECYLKLDPEKLDKVNNWSKPKNAEEIRQFTSFAGYYRRFVKDFSKMAKPVTELHPHTCYKNGKTSSMS